MANMPKRHPLQERDSCRRDSKMPELDLATDRVYGDDASPQRQTTPQPDHGIALPNRESYKVAREMLQAGTPFEEVVEMFAEVFGPQELMRVMQETEAREAEVEGGAEGRFLRCSLCFRCLS